MRNSRLLSAVALLAACTLAAHAAPIVANGTFASGLSGWSTSGSGTTPGTGIGILSLGGPGASDPYGDVILNSPNGTSTAAYFVDDNANPESLYQTITLAAATNYTLSFELYATPSGSGNPFNFTLTDSIGSPSIASATYGNTAGPGVTPVAVGSWTLETLNFTSGAAGSYLLDFSFLSGDTPAKDVVLTDVAVNPSAVPEPSAIALFGTGLLGLAGVARRRFVR